MEIYEIVEKLNEIKNELIPLKQVVFEYKEDIIPDEDAMFIMDRHYKAFDAMQDMEIRLDEILCYQVYKDIYLDSFYGTHEETDEPVCFKEFYNNEWKDPDCKEWYMSILKNQSQDDKDEAKSQDKFFTIKHILEDWFGTQIEDGENDAVIYQILDAVE